MNPLLLSEETYVWPKICDVITKKFNVLDGFNISLYNTNLELLTEKLKPYSSREFSNSERLVFSLFDTEYYIANTQIGLTSFNFINLLYTLDISWAHCMLFTNHHGIGKNLKSLCQQYGANIGITVCETDYNILTTSSSPSFNKSKDSNDIKYHFIFLSNVKRDHRTYLRCYIEDRQLNDRTLMSWQSTPTPFKKTLAESNTTATLPSTFLTTMPYTKSRDKIIPLNDELIKLYNKNQQCLTQSYRNPLIEFGPNVNNFNASFLRHGFVNISAESVFDYPYPYLTEKTFKCFWELTPFIVVGAANSLSYLRSLGFKTFDKWFDESYDQIQNPAKRLTTIFKLLDTISNWSLDHCQEVYNEMMDTLEYNAAHYKNYYCQALVEQTIKEL